MVYFIFGSVVSIARAWSIQIEKVELYAKLYSTGAFARERLQETQRDIETLL